MQRDWETNEMSGRAGNEKGILTIGLKCRRTTEKSRQPLRSTRPRLQLCFSIQVEASPAVERPM